MKIEIDVCLGNAGILVGNLIYSKDGSRESCQFRYSDDWLSSPDFFTFSPQLKKISGYQFKSINDQKSGSVFFDSFADTEPNGWGKKVILRDFAHQKKESPKGTVADELNSLDYLLWVDDFSRQGALRFRDKTGVYRRETSPEKRRTPPVLSLTQLISSTKAIELNKETRQDLEFLRGIGSDLDGMRPKCTVIDTDGSLCLAKFPSIDDTRSITTAEILAINLAKKCGIRSQDARLVNSDGVSVVLIKRFDRKDGERRMYISAGSMLEDFRGADDHTYTEIADSIRQHGAYIERDIEELWRRMVFNILIKNIDDHLHNHGFLHVRNGLWELSPAFDINSFPEKEHVLKLWISEDSGISGSIDQAMDATKRFGLNEIRAKEIISEILAGTKNWRAEAVVLGMSKYDISAFDGAFCHQQRELATHVIEAKIAVSNNQSQLPTT